MKKTFLYTMLVAAVAFALTSCGDDDTAGQSHITYYPSLDIDGSSYMSVPLGGTYTEPGYVAEMNGEDVTDEVEVIGTVNTAQKGTYNLTYSIKNADGIAATASRTVVVYDPASKADGLYFASAASYRLYNGAQAAFGRQFPIIIVDNGNGTIKVDDLLGGWYCQRAGYGVRYAMQGTLAVADDGTLSLVSSLVPGWQDGATDCTGSIDDNGDITWDCEYTDYPFIFHVVLIKQK